MSKGKGEVSIAFPWDISLPGVLLIEGLSMALLKVEGLLLAPGEISTSVSCLEGLSVVGEEPMVDRILREGVPTGVVLTEGFLIVAGLPAGVALTEGFLIVAGLPAGVALTEGFLIAGLPAGVALTEGLPTEGLLEIITGEGLPTAENAWGESRCLVDVRDDDLRGEGALT